MTKFTIENSTEYDLEDLITESCIKSIVEIKHPNAVIVKCTLIKATEGLSGFLGDHLRLKISIYDELNNDIYLFIKCLPKLNKPKLDYIKEHHYFKKEALMFRLFQHYDGGQGVKPWRLDPYICNDEIVVMPDLAIQGYKHLDKSKYFDINHCLMTLESLARMHADFVNYETHIKPNVIKENTNLFKECNFIENPWLVTGAKLASIFLKTFSNNHINIENIENDIMNAFLSTCQDIKIYENTLNTAIHKDLWRNNVFFKYNDENQVENCIIIDFQCAIFAPPAFDVMIFIYLNTKREFRNKFQINLLEHYYEKFIKNLTEKSREKHAYYTFDVFLNMCEVGKRVGILIPAMINPYVLMDADASKKVYNNPNTFEYLNNVDRSVPVLEYSNVNVIYKERLLEIYEEFVERYVLFSV